VATFGQTSAGTASSPTSADRYWASKYTLTEDGDVTQVTAFFDFDAGNSSTAGTGKAVIYADSSGSPGALMGVSSAVSIPAGDQVVDFPLTVSLTAGDYWLGIVTESFGPRLNEATGGSYVRKESLTYASPADPMGTASASGTANFAVYATYTTATLLTQARFRWRNDDGSESAATWAAAEDTNVTIAALTPKRLRVEITATGDPASAAYKLQYRKVGDTFWRDVN